MCHLIRHPHHRLVSDQEQDLRRTMVWHHVQKWRDRPIRDDAHDRAGFDGHGLMLCGLALAGLGTWGQFTDAPGRAVAICWGVGAVLFVLGQWVLRRAGR